ncbi:MAG: hypothetical protein UW30_C0002G0010 [Candidatus Giovannonibacteria bacterium GW2011_GWA2_44_13b]|uniref:Uncharacterized protein n=1 Tax=Candidatus Giovannonibacteria bacterium GW2011_GWA2_44_13b TaxID=1618647 RepID=A0A0G1K2T4_9BACT|nr:MAG: hypothetical protein UW30_C0002G0010 [Candidatus Giovannonibacteria bacterium GW2011_GWA2_44_13b]
MDILISLLSLLAILGIVLVVWSSKRRLEDEQFRALFQINDKDL